MRRDEAILSNNLTTLDTAKQWNLQLTAELAEFIAEGIYPTDIWQFVIDTLETMADREVRLFVSSIHHF